MGIQLGVGERLRSAVCATEVVVLKAPNAPVELECGGAPMVPAADATATSGGPDGRFADGTQVGKRYADADDTVELLCTKGGEGSLSLAGTLLDVKVAAALPASD